MFVSFINYIFVLFSLSKLYFIVILLAVSPIACYLRCFEEYIVLCFIWLYFVTIYKPSDSFVVVFRSSLSLKDILLCSLDWQWLV